MDSSEDWWALLGDPGWAARLDRWSSSSLLLELLDFVDLGESESDELGAIVDLRRSDM